MAALVESSLGQYGVGTATVNTASASDTITYTAGSRQLLELDNQTAGLLTLNIKGSAPSATYPVSGAGYTTDLSAGLSVALPASTKKFVYLDNIAAYLSGTGVVTLSGAATIKITAFKQ